MALTDRQKQIKALQQQGKKAPEIAAELGISTNAVYQQLRRMKTSGRGSAKTAAKPAAPKAVAAAKPAAAAAPKPAAVTKERPPLTPEKALKFERDSIAADLKVTSAELESARKAAERAEAAHAAALDGKRERVLQIDSALEALTGTRPDPLKGFETPEQIQAAEQAARVAAEEAAKAEADAVADGAKAEADAAHEAAEASQDAPEAVQGTQATATPAETPNGASKGATKTAAKTAAKAAPKGKAKPAPATKAAPVQPTTQAEREAAPEFGDEAKSGAVPVPA